MNRPTKSCGVSEGSSGLAGLRKFFLGSACVVFLITAVAKLIAANQPIARVALQDPVFSFMTTRQVMHFAAFIEIVTASVVLCSFAPRTKLAAVAWLTASFLVYRLGLALVHAP